MYKVVDTGLWKTDQHSLIDEHGNIIAHSVADEYGYHEKADLQSIAARLNALDPFVRLAEYMRDAIDGLPDDMETTIGGGDAQITVGDLRRLLEVKA